VISALEPRDIDDVADRHLESSGQGPIAGVGASSGDGESRRRAGGSSVGLSVAIVFGEETTGVCTADTTWKAKDFLLSGKS